MGFQEVPSKNDPPTSRYECRKGEHFRANACPLWTRGEKWDQSGAAPPSYFPRHQGPVGRIAHWLTCDRSSENFKLVSNAVSVVSSTAAPPEPAVMSLNDGMVNQTSVADTGEGLNDVDTLPQLEIVSLGRAHALGDDGYRVPDEAFFERPVELRVFTWTSGSVAAGYNPWQDWLNAPMVQARLKGTTYVRGTLHLKFDVAASPYQYGLLRAAIFFGDPTGYYNLGSAHFASQLLGVDIDAACPGSHEIEIPFTFPYDYLSVVDNAASDFAVSSATDAQVVCGLLMVPVVPLAMANSASSGTVSIVIRGWVTDFEGRGATRCNVVAQSGHGSKDRSAGFISGPAGLVAQAADILSKVPVIGGAAGMVGSVAGAVRDVAGLFGFSRPRSDAVTLTQKGMGSYALTDSAVVCASTAYTSKSGLSKDVRHLGFAGEDEMAISRVCGHKSLYAVIPWNTTDSRKGVLVTLSVDPLITHYVAGTPSVWHPTSLGYGALPFLYWRGSIVFTFRVVCSSFHTGILRLTYEPGFGRENQGAAEDTTWPVGMVENCMITATPGSSTTIQVCYTSQSRWKPMGTDFNILGGFANSIGRLNVTVENVLQAPLAGSGASVLVYIEAGPDFEVFGAKATMPRYGLTSNQGVAVSPQSALVSNDHTGSVCVFGGHPGGGGEVSEAIHGERVASYRALLKRYVPFATLTSDTDPAPTYFTNKEIGFVGPLVPPLLTRTAGTGTNWVYSNYNTMFRYLRLGYVGYRGGVRYRIADQSLYVDHTATTALACRPARYAVFPGLSCSPSTWAPIQNGFHALVPQTNGIGTALFDLNREEVPDVEVPDYNLASFHYAGDTGGVIPTTSEGVVFIVNKACSNSAQCNHYVSIAAADDFTFIRWQGVPPLVLVA